ncbi:MAG: NAD(P)H-hydrate epimerase [Chloroflexi bacterium]|nr:NAD(P)H-hydrate epimerase [Chloroflexota bacterium]
MSIPALTTAQMAEVDRLMIEEYGILLIQMMENAGRNLAELARRMLDGKLAGRKIVALCGAGNNGGGGMVAARHLHNWGADVQVKLIADPDKLTNVPARQWRILQTMGIVVEYTLDLARADLILDAIIGYGLTGNPRGEAAEWIERANRSGRPILALDAPSGLDTTSGLAGQPCIGATATLTLALPKSGLIAPQAQPFVGDLYLADIGVPPELYRRIGLEVGTLFAEDTIIRIN